MTTSPVPSITDELLAELDSKAKAAIPECCGEMIPTGVEYGGQREMMCCEAWQDCDVPVDALDLLALTAHIRSLAERLNEARDELIAMKEHVGYRAHTLDVIRRIDAAIAQEADHE